MADRTTTNLIGNITITRDTSYGGDFCCLNDRTDRESYVVVGTLADVAALGRALVAFAGGLTVGAALALPEVQRGEAVVELHDAEWSSPWWQARSDIDDDRLIRWRLWNVDEWSDWRCGGWIQRARWFTLPCRLVPLAEADADPATRGDL